MEAKDVVLEERFCKCGCGGKWRAMPGSPSQFHSKFCRESADANKKPTRAWAFEANAKPRRRGRPPKAEATCQPVA